MRYWIGVCVVLVAGAVAYVSASKPRYEMSEISRSALAVLDQSTGSLRTCWLSNSEGAPRAVCYPAIEMQTPWDAEVAPTDDFGNSDPVIQEWPATE